MARAHSVPAPAWPMPRKSTGAPTGHRRLRRLGLIALVALVVLVSISGVTLWRLNETVSNFPGPHFNQGKNAVWLEHTWVGDVHSNADFDALAARLTREQIRYVYAHVGPMASDG